MKVSDQKIDELLLELDDPMFFDGGGEACRNIIRSWLSEVEAEQTARIAEKLLTDDELSYLLKPQAE